VRRGTAAVLVVLLGAIGLVACGGDDQTAEERAQAAVCHDVDAFQKSAEALVGDVKDGNLGDAADQFPKVESAFDTLVASVKQLGGEKQQTIQTQLQKVESTLTGLTSLENLADVGTTLDTARSQLEQVATTVTDTLSCS
jgi:hypothetical protein